MTPPQDAADPQVIDEIVQRKLYDAVAGVMKDAGITEFEHFLLIIRPGQPDNIINWMTTVPGPMLSYLKDCLKEAIAQLTVN